MSLQLFINTSSSDCQHREAVPALFLGRSPAAGIMQCYEAVVSPSLCNRVGNMLLNPPDLFGKRVEAAEEGNYRLQEWRLNYSGW